MTRLKSTDGTLEDLGVLITAAHGLDTTWMGRGSCHGWGTQRPYQPTPWQVAPNQTVILSDGTVLKGSEMVKYAAMVCYACPAQWDCVTFAVVGKMIAGTWGVRAKTLCWLQSQDDALDLVAMAREGQIPVQEIAAQVMAQRTKDA